MKTQGILFSLVITLLLASCVSTGPHRAIDPQNPGVTLRLIGETGFPHQQLFEGTTFGAISGIDYDTKRDVYYLLSGDRSEYGPARFYIAKIPLTGQNISAPQLRSMVTLKKANDHVYGNSKTDPNHVLAPASIRYRAQTDSLWWASEGSKSLGLDPIVSEMRLDGSWLRTWPILSMFKMQVDAQGLRDNRTFQGLALADSGRTLWVATAADRFEDANATCVSSAGAMVRLTQHDAASGAARRQIAYPLDAVTDVLEPTAGLVCNGLVEVLMLDHNRLLVLERSFAEGLDNRVRLYAINVRDGSDTLTVPILRPDNFTPVTKALVLDLTNMNLTKFANSGAMSFGPRLPNGNRTLIVVANDHFSAQQSNRFIAFEVIDSRSYYGRYYYDPFGWSLGLGFWGPWYPRTIFVSPPASARPMPKRP